MHWMNRGYTGNIREDGYNDRRGSYAYSAGANDYYRKPGKFAEGR